MDEEYTADFTEPCVQCSEVDWGVSDEGRFYCRSCHNVIERTREVVDTTFVAGTSRVTTFKGTRSKKSEDRGRQWMIPEAFQFIIINQINALIRLGVNPHIKDQVLCPLWRLYLQKSQLAFTDNPFNIAHFKMQNLDSESGPESSAMSESETDGETNASGTSRSSAKKPSNSSVWSGSVDGPMYLMAEVRGSQGQMHVKKTLALIYLALVWSREPLTLSDLLRLVYEGHVPYVNAHDELPEEMKLQGKDTILFKTEGIPSHPALLKITQKLALFLQLPAFPPISRESPLHPALLSLRYLIDMNLPDDLHPWVCQLIERSGMADHELNTFDPSSNPILPQYDLQTAALIIITMKVIFGLDDQTEWDLSNETGVLDKEGNLFNIRKWFRLMEATLIRHRQKRADYSARKQWRPKKILQMTKLLVGAEIKKKRTAEQIQSCFEKLTCRPVQRCNPSSFTFCWGDKDGADGPSLHHKKLDGVLTLEQGVLTPSNSRYWHQALIPCRFMHSRGCKSHYMEMKPTLPRSYVWLLECFAFLLDVPVVEVYEAALRVERLVFTTARPALPKVSTSKKKKEDQIRVRTRRAVRAVKEKSLSS